MTDHKAEAEMLVTTELAADGVPWFATDADRIAYAQLHATLHLAEQQRLANLIAVATWNDNALHSGATKLADSDAEARERAKVDGWFAEIREGLGI